MNEKRYCAFCGNPANILCDYVIGLDKEKDINYNSMHRFPDGTFNEEARVTCDTPLCGFCAKRKQTMFVNGTKNGKQFGYQATTDWCPIHQEQHPVQPMTFDEIQWWRVEFAALIRNNKKRIELGKSAVLRTTEVSHPQLPPK